MPTLRVTRLCLKTPAWERLIRREPQRWLALLSIVLLAAAQDSDTAVIEPTDHVPNENAVADVAGYTRGTQGGVHDFDQTDGGACSACHIPHVQKVQIRSGPPPADGGELRPPPEPAVELFRIEGQRQTFVTGRYTPGPTSLICLGCHDGTLATSVIGSAHAMLAGVRSGFAVPDGFVWRDHPIGVPYPRNDDQYHPAARLARDGRVRLPDGRVECVSCHDPHNVAGVDQLLVMGNRRSALCLACHIK